MASRTLTLSLAADIDNLQKGLKKADDEIQTFGDKVSAFGKKAAAAFAIAAAAAAAYATKLAVDGVKAAIEDEAAQLRLASALETATGATDAQIKATEDYISQTSLAVGIADDELRPAFQRLAIATGDVTKSQSLLNLAIDISKGTGKDLSTVTEALSKAYAGQDTQLAKLGIGITAAQAKTMGFKDETKLLSDLYGGAASRNAETFQGRIDRLKIGFEEAKETIGFALLPIIEKLIGFIFEYGVPIVDKLKDAFNVVKEALDRNRESFNEFWILLKDKVFPIIQTVFGFLIDVGAKAAAAIIDAFGKIASVITPVLNFIIDAINVVIRGLNAVRGSDIATIGKIGEISGEGLASRPLGGAGVTGGGSSFGGGIGGGIGGGGGGGGSIAEATGATSLINLKDRLLSVQDKISELTFQTITGGISKKAAQSQLNKLNAEFQLLSNQANAITQNQIAASSAPYEAQNITNVYVSGTVVDPEGLNRVLNDISTQSFARGTGFYSP